LHYDIPGPISALAAELARLPGAAGVVLGGSRATGTARADSDWDLGLYYRGEVDPEGVRGLGHPGYVSALGEWGPIVNGGAWLTVDGLAVDVLFRDLDLVEAWWREADAGRFDVVAQNGYLAGAPTYLPVGELAIARPLAGELRRPASFPDALAVSAPPRWGGLAGVALMFAGIHARLGEPVACTGMLAQAVLSAGHARLAARREWVLNEKRLVQRAGLEETDAILGAAGTTPDDLTRSVGAVATALGIEPLAVR
jgi:predicted nucleotidyltransferase